MFYSKCNITATEAELPSLQKMGLRYNVKEVAHLQKLQLRPVEVFFAIYREY